MIGALLLLATGAPFTLQGEWSAPTQLPMSRVHAIVEMGGAFFVGGLGGLHRGRPGAWALLDDRPVRDIVASSEHVWVLFGDGSVDKLHPKSNRLYFDALKETKRPWTSCIANFGGSMMFGGMGGWIEKTDRKMEQRYPDELEGQVVTAILRFGDALWVGTQRKGLFRFGKNGTKRYGFAAGLPDSWVTALAVVRGKLAVGVAGGGVSFLENGELKLFASPVNHVQELSVHRGSLVIGGQEGTWATADGGFQCLSRAEATFLCSTRGRLYVGSPGGLTVWN